MKRPLYTISAGELGLTPMTMEDNLRTILDLAYKWDAILLLDEADVFLEERTKDDLDRNKLVSGKQMCTFPDLPNTESRESSYAFLNTTKAYSSSPQTGSQPSIVPFNPAYTLQ
jgi:hypothetical protein